MSISKPYPAPPIIDAIVELRLQVPLEQTEQAQILRAISPGYDTHKETREVDVQVRSDDGKIEAVTGPARLVHMLSNLDQNDFCRVEVSKLHWSRLPPYEGWSSFKARILRDLERLPETTGLPRIDRVGVRYRNRIDVPVEADGIYHYEDYLSVNIGLPPFLDPNHGYHWKIEKDFKDRGMAATIMSGTIPSELPGTMAVLLDIDVFVLRDIPQQRDHLMSKLEDMRSLKNELFEVCVTDKARAGFQ